MGISCSSFPSKCDIITQALETSKLQLRHVIGGRPDILKNVSLRNELLCWTSSWRNCGARAAKVGGSYVLHLAAWLCSHTHTHTHRTSDVRGIMALAFPNKSYTIARSFSPYLRARMYSRWVDCREVLEPGGVTATSLRIASYVTLSAALCIRSSSVTR